MKMAFNAGQRKTYGKNDEPIKFPRVPYTKAKVLEKPPLEVHPKFADKNYVVIYDVTEYITGVNAKMVDWWWGNMEKGYHIWVPGEHYGFDWIVPPCEVGYEGSVELSYEFDPRHPMKLMRINLSNYPFTECFEHCWLTKSSIGPVKGMLIHMYQDVEGGIEWRTVQFTTAMMAKLMEKVSSKMPDVSSHMEYESGRLNAFLPQLYDLWKDHPDPWENIHSDLTTVKNPDGTWAHKFPDKAPSM